MKHAASIAFLLAAAPLVAHAQTDAGTPPVAPTPGQALPIPSKNATAAPGQNGEVMTARERYTAGQIIAIRFVVSNNSKQSVPYNFPSGQQFDVTINDAAGKAVWTWSKGRAFTQSISRLLLPPGQRRVYTAAWYGKGDDRKLVPPGQYTINARLTSNNGPAITGNFVVGTDTDPHNMGVPTRTPADNGAIRQVDVLPPVTASKTITLLPAVNK